MYNYQIKYWTIIVWIKTHIYYVSLHQNNSEKWDTRIKVFLALTSSTSIAAWVIWDKAQFVWASIIVVAQVITAIQEYLPFKKRLKNTSEFLSELGTLFIYAEKEWYDVAEGNLNNKRIHELTIKIKSDKNKLYDKYFKYSHLPQNKNFLAMAENNSKIYFESNYQTGENNE